MTTPAASIGEVLGLLEAEHRPEFIYRGQIRCWPGPLLPSAFRCYTQTGKIFGCRECLPRASLRGSGESFVEVEPLNHFGEFADSASRARLSLPELSAIEGMIDNFGLSLSIAKNGEAALVEEVPPALQRRFAANRAAWKAVIDHMHKNRIRQMVCLNGFGYVLGMAAAQHYGFSSEALDVTHDPRVAAFFATHNSPRYAGTEDSGVGVIIRFRVGEQELAQSGWEEKHFYTAPPYIAMGPILRSFGIAGLTCAESADRLVERVLVALEQGVNGRLGHRILLGDLALQETRIFAQRAALLLPDMLLEEKELARMKLRTFMAVEDLRSRPGTEEFYFLHGPGASVAPEISRERLWPNEDMFAEMFRAVLGPGTPYVIHPTGMTLPWRPDLLDVGYAP